MIHYLHREQIIHQPLQRVWDYFSDPSNLNELTPPDMKFEIISGGEALMYEGQVIEYRVEFVPGLRSLWLTEIAHVKAGEYFVDEQRVGPYRFWYHEHHFERLAAGVKMMDKVTFAAPFGPLGELATLFWIRHRLEEIFDFRYQRIVELFGGT